MVRPTRAHIDLRVLADNYRAIVKFVTHRAPISPPQVVGVVKANAYGHGLVAVAHALESAGVDLLACADIEEGIQLRQAGVRAPILVFGALSVSDPNGVLEYDLTPTVSSPSAAHVLQAAAADHRVRLHCHLKVDTGMNRFGFRYDNLATTIPAVLASPNLRFDAVYTHFATAEAPAGGLFDIQRRRFGAACDTLRSLGLRGARRHAANSAALLRDRSCWLDAVRPGLLVYGVTPPREVAGMSELTVNPVMSLRSRVVAVKGLRTGDTSGYGARFTARRPSLIAIVPAGYADGLDVRLAGTGHVLVRGCPAPIIGSVCMDSITVDVTDLDVSPGDEVVVIGPQGHNRVGAADVAEWVGTVPHEVLSRVGTRIERVYGPDAEENSR
jgi:alanine racemase